ncbi:hypothetical protein F4678DRAFT_329830 [Xylaria arbuscula]|nr:hypothetical protein F4678DRAFT_329830 [Xylaria arbuscula]
MPYDGIVRDGFSFDFGRFRRKSSGRGLREDNVPPKLRNDMRAEWLAQLTLEEISPYPEYVMERFFLTSRQPDRAKTTTVIGIPFVEEFDGSGEFKYDSDKLCEAVSKISGLYYARGLGAETDIVFIGWDSAAVIQAAERYSDEEGKAAEAAVKKRNEERSKLHEDYLKTLKQEKGCNAYSPTGSYVVSCDEIEYRWPDRTDNTLNIRETDESGIYEVSFDLGIFHGVMIIGADERAVELYGGSDDNEDSPVGEKESGSKRKGTAASLESCDRHSPPKKVKSSAPNSLKYYFKLRCAEEEDWIYHQPKYGTITFKDDNMASFTGKLDLPCDSDLAFIAQKTSDVVNGQQKSWSDYSEAEAVYQELRHRRLH